MSTVPNTKEPPEDQLITSLVVENNAISWTAFNIVNVIASALIAWCIFLEQGSCFQVIVIQEMYTRLKVKLAKEKMHFSFRVVMQCRSEQRKYFLHKTAVKVCGSLFSLQTQQIQQV